MREEPGPQTRLPVVDERVDDLKHLLLPKRHLAEARAEHKVAHLVQRRPVLREDELQALLPEHLDELGVVLVLGVPAKEQEEKAAAEKGSCLAPDGHGDWARTGRESREARAARGGELTRRRR